MKYDFTSIMDRRGMDSIAVDGLGAKPGFAPDAPKLGFDAIPMWVADMNFPTVPTITEAIINRAKHPAFGYFAATPEYYSSIISWHAKRNGVTGLSPEHIGYENGVLGGVISALTCYAAPGDAVLIHSPTYIGFTMCVENNGYKIIHSPLVKDEKGIWRMDYEDMDRKIKENNIHVAIFCSPHNPCGRVWERSELEKAMEIYKNNDCVVISDEIWSDIILNGHKHIPTQSVSEDARERTVAVYAPSKTFNLAGLVGSYHIIYNKTLRDRVSAKASKPHYNDMNVLSMHALIGAYKREGHEWVDELNEVISGNVNYACDFISKHFKGVEVSKPEGTYMLFLDCTAWCKENGKTIDELEKMGWDVGVAWQDGRMFHGPCSIRLNLALPLSRVKEAFARMDKYVFNRDPELKEPESKVVNVGDIFDDFTYNTPFRKGLTLSASAAKAKKTAIIFLRYFGCTICQYDIHQLIVNYDKLTRNGGQILVVLQSDPAVAGEGIKESDIPFDIVCDPKAELYIHNSVFPAKTLSDLADNATMAKIMAASQEGFKHGKYEGSELQLPATFIIDKDRKVLYSHYGKSGADIPSIKELEQLLS